MAKIMKKQIQCQKGAAQPHPLNIPYTRNKKISSRQPQPKARGKVLRAEIDLHPKDGYPRPVVYTPGIDSRY